MARKQYDSSKPLHLEEMKIFLLEDDEEEPAVTEDLEESSDISSEDEVAECNTDSGTEQDGDDTDTEETDTDLAYYLGKDKNTKWNKKAPKNKQRRESHNIITHLPGVIGSARKAKTAVECWSNLITDSMLETIVRFTNQYIDTIKEQFSRERDIKNTDVIELKAFIGLLYLAGAFRANRQSLEELWGTDGDGIEKFSLVMNLKRFKVLIRCLRFDNQSTRTERKGYDRLAPIRDIFQQFIMNCQKSYCSGQNLTIDEMLPGFRGRCGFRQYIPSKPNKYGIKIFAMVDARMMYTMNMEVYCGRQPPGPFNVSNKLSDVVKRIAEPVFGSGRNITADNWFTDFDLIDFLKTKKLSYVGTVRKNKRQLPPDFLYTKGKPQYSTMFGFSNGKILVSYIPRERKNVILVSSLHNDYTIDPESGELRKPEIITFYNLTKSGVDTADQMCGNFNVSRNTKRWPMVIFFTMLNVGGINSQVIYLSNELKQMRRRMYLKQLANELVSGELSLRSTKTVGMPLALQHRLKRYRPKDVPEQTPTLPPSKRRSCTTCSFVSGFRRLSKYDCKICKESICLSHGTFVCQPCFSKCTCAASAAIETTEDE
ncbi:piggyBac transposable element-derived protein 4-like [Ranitomeya imitator]|uniref:piggyBac transposable element-derived protein 4-like n=1 Tax=Ranitomeya imitator TaxID=111125 RepID=UPI0037E966CE